MPAEEHARRGRAPRLRSRALARLLPGLESVRAGAVAYAAQWDRRNAEVLADRSRRPLWVVLGDSMSQGVGASSFETGWVNRSAPVLVEAGLIGGVVNLSATGATTLDVLERQLPALEEVRPSTSLVTLVVGANDMMRRADRSRLEDRYRTILEALPRGSVVARMPPPVPVVRRVNALIEQAAVSRGLVAIDMSTSSRPFSGQRAGDFFHPNDRGYRRIADRFLETVLRRA